MAQRALTLRAFAQKWSDNATTVSAPSHWEI